MRSPSAALAATSLVGTPFLLLASCLSGEKALYYRDIMQQYVPDLHFLHTCLENGLPLHWNPLEVLGAPFAAISSKGAYYPVSLALASLPIDAGRAYAWWVAFHLAWAGLGTYLWLRVQGHGPFPAWTGGVTYSWGGTLMSCISLAPLLAPAAWIPWTGLVTERLRRGGSRLLLPLLVLCLAFQWCAAAPLVALQGLLFLMVVWYWGGARPGRPRDLFLCCLAAAGLLGVMWVPMLEAAGQSARLTEGASRVVLRFSTTPTHLSSLLLSPPFPCFDDPKWAASFGSLQVPLITWLYVGPILLWLAWVGARRGRSTPSHLHGLGPLFLVLLIASLGSHLPGVSRLAEAASGLFPFRYPEKLLLLPALILGVFAAEGATTLALQDKDERDGPKPVQDGLEGPLILFCAAGLLGSSSALFMPAMSPGGSAASPSADTLLLLGPAMSWVRLLVVSGCALALRGPGSRFGRATWKSLLLPLLIAVDLLGVNAHLIAEAPGDFHTRSPFLKTLGEASRAVPRAVFGLPLGEHLLRVGAGGPLAQHRHDRNGLVAGVPALHGWRSMRGFGAIHLSSHQRLERALNETDLSRLSRILAHLAVPYAVFPERLSKAGFSPIDEREGTVLHEVAAPLPRAYVAEQVLVSPAPFDTWLQSVTEVPPRANLRLAVIRQGSPGQEEEERLSLAAAPPRGVLRSGAGGMARIVEDRPDRVAVEVHPKGPSILVLLDQWYPGWQVEVDGDARPILEVNGLARGIVLEEGDRRVVFRYRSRGFSPGLGLSVLGASLAVFLAL